MLDVVVPHLNAPYLVWCLESLRQFTPTGVLASVSVIDQSGKPDLYLRNVDYHVRCREQVGFARAANLGISLGRAPYVMVLNDDCQFLDRRWWYGVMKTFETHPNLLCVNPSSPYNPGHSCNFTQPEDIKPSDYSSLLNGSVLDGICMWAPVFHRQRLNEVKGVKPGLWFDERFWPGGGEDYDLNRRAALSGMRCVGTGWSWVWHWWHATEFGGKKEAKYDGGTFERKWRADDQSPDLFGNTGLKDVPMNQTLEGQ